jgi:anaerobic magnesium-protoporphyrin IX monomethyl ester cyclase
MNIGFIFPNKDRRYKTMHLGLAYLAAYARQEHSDLNFKVLDTRVASKKETKAFFSSPFDLIGITVYSPVYYEVIDVFNRVRKTYPGVPVCLGGPYVTTIGKEIFEKTPADFAVYGEGEITFSEIIDHLKGKKAPVEINGLMYLNENGEIVTNPPREHINDLNCLPLPAWELLPMNRYPLHRIITSRGCPYACAWCNSSSIWNNTYRERDAGHVVAEIEYLIKNYDRKIFVFGDNTFNVSPERVEAICDLLIEKDLNILWSVSVRADNMTQQTADKMKAAGCYNVAIGIESADNELLRKMNKCTTIEQIAAGIKMLKKAGIEVLSQYVIGSPGETLETVKKSIEYAKNAGCDYSNFYTVLPFKGTPQWNYVEKHGKFYCTNIHDFHTINPRIVFETPEFTYAERLKAIQLAKREGFYSNKDKKSFLFDHAKDISRKMQQLLPESVGQKLYMLMKSVYKMKLVKKHNI